MASARPPAKRARMTLSERRAWHIALSVGEPLRGCVFFAAADPLGEGNGFPTYEWLEIHVPPLASFPRPRLTNALAWITHAREAGAVWHMLSCCKGFRGHDNDGVFWKRLVDALPPNTENRKAHWLFLDPAQKQYVNDASVFFPFASGQRPHHDASAFPRFRLVLRSEPRYEEYGEASDDEEDEAIESAHAWFNAAVRVFTGLERESRAVSDVSVRAHVDALLAHVDETRWLEQAVEIGVRIGDFFMLSNLPTVINQLVMDMEAHANALEVSRRRSLLLRGHVRFPVVTFKNLAVNCTEPFELDREIDDLAEIIKQCQLTIPRLSMYPSDGRITDQAVAKFLATVNDERRPGACGHVEKLEIDLSGASERQVEMVFSSLPTTDMRRLRVCSYSRWNADCTLDEHAWAWLAYAVYHPWVSKGKLKYLDLDDLDISEPTAAPIRGVRTAQSTLYRRVYGEEDDSVSPHDPDHPVAIHYSFVNVRAGTKCFENRTLLGHELCDDFDKVTTLTAILMASTHEMMELPDAVCVVLPTLGHGWVAREGITKLWRCQADGSAIEGFTIGTPHVNTSLLFSSMLPLMPSVIKLDIAEWGSLSTSELRNVLRGCRRLKELIVEYNGDLFHEWGEPTARSMEPLDGYDSLDALTMVCGHAYETFRAPSVAAWKTILRNVRLFQVSTLGSTPHHQDGVRNVLQHGYAIERFVWMSRTWASRTTRRTYQENRAKTRKFLAITDGKNDKFQQPLSEKARLAFASVIKRIAVDSDPRAARGLRPRKGHGLGKLSQDVARLICDFATTDHKRVVWVEEH